MAQLSHKAGFTHTNTQTQSNVDSRVAQPPIPASLTDTSRQSITRLSQHRFSEPEEEEEDL